jgi:DNA-binding NarL/FixJ family response regulator
MELPVTGGTEMKPGNKSFRILLADDHVLIRHGIKNIIKKDDKFRVVGEVSNGEELMVFLEDSQVAMIILDISMPGIGGMEATGLVKSKYPRIKILILTMHKNRQYCYNAMAAGGMTKARETSV